MYACFLLGPVRHAPIMQTRADTHRLWRAPFSTSQSKASRLALKSPAVMREVDNKVRVVAFRAG